ncbi:MAG: hypothetical protein IPK80_19230 [Nannocystis sp.]|nr:hypothetical protein [Nannocystis sp.]
MDDLLIFGEGGEELVEGACIGPKFSPGVDSVIGPRSLAIEASSARLAPSSARKSFSKVTYSSRSFSTS